MKKYLLLALASLLFPAVAGAIEPKNGYYEGEAVALSGIVRKQIKFHYSGFVVTDLFIDGKRTGIYRFKTSGDDEHFRFDEKNNDSQRYLGHGRWHKSEEAAGDFREYLFHGNSETNTYYTWHAHWKRK